MDKSKESIFRKRKITYITVFAIIITLYLMASVVTEFKLSDGIKAFPNAAVWMVNKFIPDEKALTRFSKIIGRLMETALLSVAVTSTAAVMAFVFSLFGSKTLKSNGIMNQAVRMVAAFFRNVPDVVWAMLLMFSFGQNILTGFLALFFSTFGMLTRSFIEIIDEVSSSCVEALDATGANFAQIVFQGVIPSSLTGLMTWVLYMIETNIRSSTLIGILTATGIGYLFDMYYKRLEFGSASLVVISIVVLVIIIETVSNKLRKVIE